MKKLFVIGIPHPAALKPTLKKLWGARHFAVYKLPGAAKRFARNDFAALPAICRRWSPTWDPKPEEFDAVRASFSNPASLDAAFGYYRTRLIVQQGKAKAPSSSASSLAVIIHSNCDCEPIVGNLWARAVGVRRFGGRQKLSSCLRQLRLYVGTAVHHPPTKLERFGATPSHGPTTPQRTDRQARHLGHFSHGEKFGSLLAYGPG